MVAEKSQMNHCCQQPSSAGAGLSETRLGQYYASVIKIERMEVASELDASPEPNSYITALHPTICIFEVMRVKLDK